MKILHINTFASGGAFTAALRLHEGLLRTDIDSHMLTLGLASHTIANHQTFPQFSRFGLSFPKRLANKINIKSLREIERQKALGKLSNPVEYFSSPLTDYDVASYINKKCDADIIHLHWVANFIDYPSFFKYLKKPIVWTLHDQAPFSSYWHYSEDYKEGDYSRKLHSEYLAVKNRALNGFNLPVNVVAPSNWLKQSSEQSEVLGRFPHHLIRYGLHTDIFKQQQEKPDALAAGMLREESTKILFICQALNNRRKGIDLLVEAVNLLEVEFDVQLIAVGEYSDALNDALGTRIHFTGTVADQLELAKLYSAVDCMVIPSRQDNLPNTLLESLSCGTPVIGTPAGGIAEILADKQFGVLASEFTPQSLAEALRNFIRRKDDFNKDGIERTAHTEFELTKQANEYAALYEHIAEKS